MIWISHGSCGPAPLLTGDVWLLFQFVILDLDTLTWVDNWHRFTETQLCSSSPVSPSSAVFGDTRHPHSFRTAGLTTVIFCPSMPSLTASHQGLDTDSCLDIGKSKSSEMLKLRTALVSKIYELMPLAWH